ncbi:MAG TPA: antibiotic biosynthesis monooxygenase [Candidatus Binataceae bacterium]|jgi:heme-degrading monooxygenase HmoA|nr:antibiotic biosynthesis monooxygenase [Candidatus Binataceae bacterium]
MIIAISNFTVTNEEAELIAARFSRRSRKVDRHRGFLGLDVLSKTTVQGTTFMLMTRWTNRAALRAYLTSDDFRVVHAESSEQQAEFAVYEVVAN